MKKRLILILNLIIPTSLLPMQPAKEQYDPYFDGVSLPNFKSIDDAHQIVRQLKAFAQHEEQLNRAVTAYRKKDWNIPAIIKLTTSPYYRPRIGSMATDGIQTITIIGELQPWLTPQETEFSFAHELAHIALRNHRWFNLHWYMDLYTNPLSIGIILATTSMKVRKLTGAKKNFKAMGVTTLGGGYAISTQKINAGLTHFPNQDTGTIHSRYACLNKLEEIECDVIAAFVLPEGGRHGTCFFQKLLSLKGEGSGESHPRNSTRVKYLTAIQWLQEHGIEKHT